MYTYTIPALLSILLSVTARPCDQDVLFIQASSSAPKTTEHVYVNEGANGGLYLCENAGFKGYCVHYTNPFGQCSKPASSSFYTRALIQVLTSRKLQSPIVSPPENEVFQLQALTVEAGVPCTRMPPCLTASFQIPRHMLTISVPTGRPTAMGKSFRFTTLGMRICLLLVGMTRFAASTVLQNKYLMSNVSVLLRLAIWYEQSLMSCKTHCTKSSSGAQIPSLGLLAPDPVSSYLSYRQSI
jgi:hypothetical protein